MARDAIAITTILVAILAACQVTPSGPSESALAPPAVASPSPAPPASRWADPYLRVVYRMTEEQVQQEIGPPTTVTQPQSGLVTWIYGQGDGTGLRDDGMIVIFAGGMVLKVTFFRPPPADLDLSRVRQAVQQGMLAREVWIAAGPPTRAEHVGAERDVEVLTYGDPNGRRVEVLILEGRVSDIRER